MMERGWVERVTVEALEGEVDMGGEWMEEVMVVEEVMVEG